MTPDPGQSDARIELRTSELYHRHKRNLVFASSVAIVLAASRPAENVKIIGMGESSIPAAFAYAFIASAIIYFAMQFYAEFLVVRARNVEFAARKSDASLDAAFSKYAKQLSELREAAVTQLSWMNDVERSIAIVQQHVRWHEAEIETYLASLQSSVRASIKEALNYTTPIKLDLKLATDRVIERLEKAVSNEHPLELAGLEAMAGLRAAMLTLESSTNELCEQIRSVTIEHHLLRQDFGKLAGSIYRVQRVGMNVLDGAIPGVLAAVALAACAAGAFGLIPASSKVTAVGAGAPANLIVH